MQFPFPRLCCGCKKFCIAWGPLREVLSPHHHYWHTWCWNHIFRPIAYRLANQEKKKIDIPFAGEDKNSKKGDRGSNGP